MVELNGEAKDTVVPESVVDQIAKPVVVSTETCQNGSSPKKSDEDVISPSKPVECKKMKLDVNGVETDMKNGGEVGSKGAESNGEKVDEVLNGDSNEKGTNEVEPSAASTETKSENADTDVEKMETDAVELKVEDPGQSLGASSDLNIDGSGDTNGDHTDAVPAETNGDHTGAVQADATGDDHTDAVAADAKGNDHTDAVPTDAKGHNTDANNAMKPTDEEIEKAENSSEKSETLSGGNSDEMETGSGVSVPEIIVEKTDDSDVKATENDAVQVEGTKSPEEQKISPVGETCVETGVTHDTTEKVIEKKNAAEDEIKAAETTESIGTEAKSETCKEAAENQLSETERKSDGEAIKESESIAKKAESPNVPESETPVQVGNEKGEETIKPATELEVASNDTATANSEVEANTDEGAAKTDDAKEKSEN